MKNEKKEISYQDFVCKLNDLVNKFVKLQQDAQQQLEKQYDQEREILFKRYVILDCDD